MKLHARIIFGTIVVIILPTFLIFKQLKEDTGKAELTPEPVAVTTYEEIDSVEDYLEPLVNEDFQTESRETPLIPHIIHQTYTDEKIPARLTKYVKSVKEKNPKWTYFLWTDSSARKLVSDKYPELLELWDGYISPINRADVIRLIVLHEFGGFYGDLDVECIRPLDRLTYKYSCIIPPEPFEQAVFRLKAPYLLNNAVMMCRKNHPFFKFMLNTLHEYKHMIGLIDVAGPAFVTSIFIRYNNISVEQLHSQRNNNSSNSPYFYKGLLPEDDFNAVYVPNTKYFINSLSQDWMNEKHYKNICSSIKTKNDFERKACNELYRRLRQQNRDRFAFTDHHWDKSYDEKKRRTK